MSAPSPQTKMTLSDHGKPLLKIGGGYWDLDTRRAPGSIKARVLAMADAGFLEPADKVGNIQRYRVVGGDAEYALGNALADQGR